MIRTRSDKAKNSNPALLLLLGCGFLLLVGIAALGYQKIEYKTKLNLTQQLQATLKTHAKALDFWWQDKIRDATVLAGNKQTRKQILPEKYNAKSEIEPFVVPSGAGEIEKNFELE